MWITFIFRIKFCYQATIGLSAKPRQAFIIKNTQNLFIFVAHTTRVKADDPLCANPWLSLSTHTHTLQMHIRVHAPPRPLLTHSIYLYIMPWPNHSGSTEQREDLGWFSPSLAACLSVPPSISLPNMFNAQNTNSFHTESSSAVHNHVWCILKRCSNPV